MYNNDADVVLMNADYKVYQNLIKLDEWKIVYQDNMSSVFIPTSRGKGHWIIPDEKFTIDYEGYKKRILN